MIDGNGEMPEGLPAQFWDGEAGEVDVAGLSKSYSEAATFKAKHDAHLATLPRLASDYKIELKLPEGVTAPEGMQLDYAKDQRVGAVREFAHRHQLSQEALTELIALDAESQIAEHTSGQAEFQAEMEKLGGNSPARINALETALGALISKEEYEALRGFIGDATAFVALEKLIAKATAQGVPANLDGGGPTPNPPAKVRPADVLYGARK